MKPKSRLRGALMGTSVIFLTLHHATAADGSWNVDDNGFWSEEEKWTPGVADGDGFTAFFTNDQTVDAIVTLDSPRTIGNLVFGDAGLDTPAGWTLSGGHPLTLSGPQPTVTVNELAPDKVATITGVVTGTGGLVKAGSGTLSLTGVNTLTGGVSIQNGVLLLTNSNQLATTNTLTIGPAGKLRTNSGGVTFGHPLAGSGTLDIVSNAEVRYSGNWSAFIGTVNILTTGGGKLNITDGNFVSPSPEAVMNIPTGASFFTANGRIFPNQFTVVGTGNTENRGALRLDGGSAISGGVTLLGDSTIGNSSGAGVVSTVSGVIDDAGVGHGIATAATGAGTIVLSGVNTFSGPTTIAGQTAFSVAQINPAGAAGNLGRNGTIQFGAAGTGGTLIYTGAGETTDRVINLAGTTGGGAITHNGAGLLKFTSDLTATGFGAKTLTVQGTGPGEFAGAIVDGDASGGTILTKAGTGTWTLSGASTFTGTVNVNSGTLVVAHPAALGAPESSAPNKLIILGAGGQATLDLATDTGVDTYRFWGSSNNPSTVLVNRATPGPGITHAFGNSGPGNNVYTFAAGPNVTSGTASVSFASINLAAGGAGTATLNPTTASLTVDGPVNIGSNNAAKALNLGGSHPDNLISGVVSDGLNVLSLAKSNTSQWTITGDRTYTGTTTVSGGTLRLHGASVTTGATTVAGGLLVLRGDHSGVTAASAGTTVGGGTLRLDYSVADSSKLSNFAVLTFGGGMVELVDGSHVEVVSSTTLAAGSSSNVSRVSGTAVLQLNTITPGAGAVINFTGNHLATTDNLNTNGILGTWATVTVDGVTDWAANATDSADGSIAAYTGYTDITRLGVSTVPNEPTDNVRIVNGGTSGGIALAGGALTSIHSLKMVATDGPSVIGFADPGDRLMIGNEAGGGILQPALAGGLTIGSAPGHGSLTTGLAPNGTAASLRFINDSINDLVINAGIVDNGTDVVSIGKAGTGTLVLSGTNTFTGSVGIGGGAVLLGSSTGIGTGRALTMAASTLLDLNGFDTSITTLTAQATSVVTDGSATAGTTTLAITNVGAAVAANFRDGSQRALALRITNSNGNFSLNNPANTFSGGLVLTHTAAGTRMSPGAIVASSYGTGPITVGESAADRAGIFISAANQTLTNPIIANTGLGTDRVGTFRVDAGGTLLTGDLTAGSSDVTFSTNGNGNVTATGKISGNNGVRLLSHTLGGASLTVTLANAAGTNDYAGSTTINHNPQVGRSFTLALGAAHQIPNGPGKGNVIINTNGTGIGALQLAGHHETINGLFGTGTVTSNAGTPVLTLGDTDADSDFSGIITGTLALTKTGTGALTLGGTAASTYSGPTILHGGLITAGKGSAFGGAGPASGTLIHPTVTLNTNSQNFGAERFTLAGGTIKNDGATDQVSTMQRLDVTADSTVGGLRRWDVRGGGLGGLTIASGVTLTKTDANLVAVVQNPLVNHGTIEVASGTFGLHLAVPVTGSGNIVVNPGTTFEIGSYGTICTVANPVSVIDGTLAGINDGGGPSRFDSPVTVTGSNTFRADSGFVINGSIGGGGSINKTGGAALTINGTTSFSGDTTVTSGTLTLTLPSTLDDDSTVRISATGTLNLAAAGDDAVAALIIDEVPLADGIWGAEGSGAPNETPRITGLGRLVVGDAAADPFDAWALANGLDGSAGKENGRNDDPDGDGFTNLSEFAFDGDPLDGADNAKVFVFTADSSDEDPEDDLVLTIAVRKTAPVFAGEPSPVASVDGITYTIEGSIALDAFTHGVTPVLPLTTDLPATRADYEYRSFKLNGSEGLAGTGFLRARVTAP